MNVLKPHLQTTIATLLATNTSHRQIERVTGIDRKTIRTYAKRIGELKANSPGVATGTPDQIPPPRPPIQVKLTTSTCEPHREFIEAQLRFKRNYMAIYQDLVPLLHLLPLPLSLSINGSLGTVCAASPMRASHWVAPGTVCPGAQLEADRRGIESERGSAGAGHSVKMFPKPHF